MHFLVQFSWRYSPVSNLAVPTHTIRQGLYFKTLQRTQVALAWGPFIEFYEPSSDSLMEKLPPELERSGVIYIASDYGGDFKSQFAPRLTVLMGQIIWDSQWKTGGAEKEGARRPVTGRRGQKKTYGAGSVTRVDTKKKAKSKRRTLRITAARWRRGELEVCWLTAKRPRYLTVQTHAGSRHLI